MLYVAMCKEEVGRMDSISGSLLKDLSMSHDIPIVPIHSQVTGKAIHGRQIENRNPERAQNN